MNRRTFLMGCTATAATAALAPVASALPTGGPFIIGFDVGAGDSLSFEAVLIRNGKYFSSWSVTHLISAQAETRGACGPVGNGFRLKGEAETYAQRCVGTRLERCFGTRFSDDTMRGSRPARAPRETISQLRRDAVAALIRSGESERASASRRAGDFDLSEVPALAGPSQ